MRGKVLVSACLLGEPVRYDGAPKTLRHSLLDRLKAEGRIVPFCPEMAGGLPTPRPPAEISDGASGEDVLDGRAQVRAAGGEDMTDPFLAGAQAALEAAKRSGCVAALLTDGSPSCGGRMIYDGHFQGTKHPGMGVTAALFDRHDIAVFTDGEAADLERFLDDGPPPASSTP